MIKSIKLLGTVIMALNTNLVNAENKLITHKDQSNSNISQSEYAKKLTDRTDLALPLNQELEMLQQLSEFELGRFLLLNKGLNGYWTSYLILHGLKKENLHPLEKWVLESAPAVRATRERFYIFQKVLQENLKNNITIASIPCGVMDDLTRLNTGSFQNISYVGIDYDNQSIDLARRNSNLLENVSISFHQKDAWNLKLNSQFDIITSNGLNIYEPDDDKVVDLYRNFYKSLKPNGILITSFLTPPPALSQESTWKNYNPTDVIKQKALFVDIIAVNWQAFRTEKQTRKQLEDAGFKKINFIYDSQGMFPIVIAKK